MFKKIKTVNKKFIILFILLFAVAVIANEVIKNAADAANETYTTTNEQIGTGLNLVDATTEGAEKKPTPGIDKKIKELNNEIKTVPSEKEENGKVSEETQKKVYTAQEKVVGEIDQKLEIARKNGDENAVTAYERGKEFIEINTETQLMDDIKTEDFDKVTEAETKFHEAVNTRIKETNSKKLSKEQKGYIQTNVMTSFQKIAANLTQLSSGLSSLLEKLTDKMSGLKPKGGLFGSIKSAVSGGGNELGAVKSDISLVKTLLQFVKNMTTNTQTTMQNTNKLLSS
jgi:hypothetical protein